MTNRTNPQHGANMVDRYIGSSFDVVYAVYKIVDQLPMIYKFAVEHLPELERLVEEKVDKVEGKELSSNDFTDAYVDQLGLIRSAAYENIEAFEPAGSVAAALQAAKNYADGVLVQAKNYTNVRELALMAIINGQAQEIQANEAAIADLLQRVIALETAP